MVNGKWKKKIRASIYHLPFTIYHLRFTLLAFEGSTSYHIELAHDALGCITASLLERGLPGRAAVCLRQREPYRHAAHTRTAPGRTQINLAPCFHFGRGGREDDVIDVVVLRIIAASRHPIAAEVQPDEIGFLLFSGEVAGTFTAHLFIHTDVESRGFLQPLDETVENDPDGINRRVDALKRMLI